MTNDSGFIERSWEMNEKDWWDHWNSAWRAEDEPDGVSTELYRHVMRVVREITEDKSIRILEVACGTGIISRRLNFSTYHGLDLSAAAIGIARQKAESMVLPPGAIRPTYEATDFHDWLLPREHFDLVLCVDAISCFRDQGLVMRKMAEGVRAGGYVVLTTLNPFVWERIRRPDGGRFQNGPVSHWLSRREFHALISRSDLNLVSSYTIMPRGNEGILRVINSWRLDGLLGPRAAGTWRKLKERMGLGQYRVIVARKTV